MTDMSVIIAAYNVERYIERAIMSALTQTGINLEVIVIDDCSTDQTVAFTEKIDDPRVRIIRQAKNGGPSASRNAGIAAARGEWIAILDGDDQFAPGRLAHLLQTARTHSADIVVDNLMNVYEEGRAPTPMFEPSYFATLHPLTLSKFIAGNQSFFSGTALGYLKPMFSSAFLKHHHLSYDPDIRIGEDYLLMAHALADGATCAVDQNAGYLYTVRTGSISHRLKPDDVYRIEALDQKFLGAHTLADDALRAQINRTRHIREALAFTLLVEAIKGRDMMAATRALFIAPRAIRLLWLPIASRGRWLYAKVFKS